MAVPSLVLQQGQHIMRATASAAWAEISPAGMAENSGRPPQSPPPPQNLAAWAEISPPAWPQSPAARRNLRRPPPP
jgi:hypothetical protein